MLLTWLLAQGGDPPVPFNAEPLWQYGAVGIFASICMYAVYKLYSSIDASQKAEIERLQGAHRAELERIEAAHRAAIERADAAYKFEVARGDRMESGLGDLNRLINDKLAGELANATDAIREALEMTRDRRRT